ncbi:MAG: hypothetical protein WA208_13510, partial [Thermoanaerobaculia bacterium]
MTASVSAGAIAFIASAVLTGLVRAAARRLGLVAQPKADRWHQRPTAMFGGVAIAAAVGAGWLSTTLPASVRVVLLASGVMFVVGLIDDHYRLRPYQKLVGQVGAAAIVLGYGLVLAWTPWPAVNIALTVFWLVGITNAVNMLDNMDGLAAGIAAIAAACLALNFARSGQAGEAAILWILCGALLGFLIYNFNPASIFMGDCGALFIGFLLASSALMGQWGGRSRSVVAVLAIPVLTLFIPIFDTTFVTLARKAFGRRASQGGRDHTSHRLVALGLPERQAVLFLYLLASTAGGIALSTRELETDVSLAMIGAFIITMAIIGAYLARVKVYDAQEAPKTAPLLSFIIEFSYKRRIFEVLLDVVLIVSAYYVSYRVRFGPPDGGPDWAAFIDTLPVVIGATVVTFLATGMYRGLWRYISAEDVLVYARSVATATAVMVLWLLFVSRFAGLSRVAFLVNAGVLFVLIVATRSSFRIFRALVQRVAGGGTRAGGRVLIYGAGDAGEILFRELTGNASLERHPVAFFD